MAATYVHIQAHGDVFIAITERGGDGVADPSLGSLAAWFK